MRKQSLAWSMDDLLAHIGQIHFPEYQREPNVWNRRAKQMLIDSISRSFDISSIYLYRHDDEMLDCVDGRQRIGAILAFLGQNEEDEEDNGFVFRSENEIYSDLRRPFEVLNDKSYRDIVAARDDGVEAAAMFLERFHNYPLTLVLLSDVEAPEEFNLQFARLNLGTIINSGEKLHAMVGELRNACFDKESGLGVHPFLTRMKIPTRRFASQQVAVQIVGQYFAWRESGEKKQYTRMRHFDMQTLIKRHERLVDPYTTWLSDVRMMLDALDPAFSDGPIIRSRAVAVSAVLLAFEIGVPTTISARDVARFLDEYLVRLKWQVGLGLDANPEYRHLLDFQKHLTQASVERPAVEARAEMLREAFHYWKRTTRIPGDDAFIDRGVGSPSVIARRHPLPAVDDASD